MAEGEGARNHNERLRIACRQEANMCVLPDVCNYRVKKKVWP